MFAYGKSPTEKVGSYQMQTPLIPCALFIAQGVEGSLRGIIRFPVRLQANSYRPKSRKGKKMNTSINENNAAALNITESTTLGELISILNLGEKPNMIPTPKMLRETAGEPVATDDRIVVYKNGFAVYDNGSGRTVVWLPDCKSFTYIFVQPKESEVGIVPEKEKLPDGFLETQPWAIAVTVIGDHRVEANLMNRSGSRVGTRDFDFDDNGDKDGGAEKKVEESFRKEYTWKEGHLGENPLDKVIREEEQKEDLAKMTREQAEAFVLYYRDGYTQEEVAEILNISRSSVRNRLNYALKKIK
ncbi:MAG: sigma-70 family RNA polymerase sigma factor [Lachnospiraceae bacterium]|nr:sigma-70 family RNA polymerase sigma factor [Lachnospiraceae bacterium]